MWQEPIVETINLSSLTWGHVMEKFSLIKLEA
nr:MAG TPA: hypothetical protein [Caudoviricetes sp.]